MNARCTWPTATSSVATCVGVRLTEGWGQQLVIDPRPGASGIIGAEFAARAAPNGYTLAIAISVVPAALAHMRSGW